MSLRATTSTDVGLGPDPKNTVNACGPLRTTLGSYFIPSSTNAVSNFVSVSLAGGSCPFSR